MGSFHNSKKAIGLNWQENNFASASRFFVHFSAVVARLRHETFLNLDTVLSDSTQNISPTFDKLNETE